jgi:hypothetical protein
MNRNKLIAILMFSLLLLSLSLSEAKKKRVPPDMRNIVTAVDPATHSITVTSMFDKVAVVYQMADPAAYPNEIIIDNQEKKFTDITKGLQYVASVEVSPNVVQSITLRKADPAPK